MSSSIPNASGPLPRVTFGMIVLNGMPFVPYNVRALYPYAHEIIVVEGAAPGAANIATPDGHSRDGTLQELHQFAEREDPDGKLTIVTAEDDGHADGFWPGEKDEQSQAYAIRATGDYLWQIDADEFYLPHDMETVLGMLSRDPSITQITFPVLNFWGALWCQVDGWYLRRGAAAIHRLFRWGPGYTYARHRPPVVLDPTGCDLRELAWIKAPAMARRGIVIYHYSLLLPDRVMEKEEYHTNWGLSPGWFGKEESQRWLADSYLSLRRPFRVHNVWRYPAWLEPYSGPHPPQILAMMADIESGRIDEPTRPMHDAARLLRSRRYTLGRALLRLAEPLDRRARQLRWTAAPYAHRILTRVRGG